MADVIKSECFLGILPPLPRQHDKSDQEHARRGQLKMRLMASWMWWIYSSFRYAGNHTTHAEARQGIPSGHLWSARHVQPESWNISKAHLVISAQE
jgi:hypothetical protein